MYTRSSSKHELPKSMSLIVDLFGDLSKMFSESHKEEEEEEAERRTTHPTKRS